MNLDDKGRCCGKKPLDYKGGNVASPRIPHKFCPRCDRAYDRETGKQIENWAWVQYSSTNEDFVARESRLT